MSSEILVPADKARNRKNPFRIKCGNINNKKGKFINNTDPSGIYYIYTANGTLLAEYDVHGDCIRDYIYFGSVFAAEYDPLTGEYFYYTQDHIGSTRIVTDDAGSAVSAEAYSPYGDIQKTWVNEFNPTFKYSGKERDTDTGFDYFGARYYSNKCYRWISTDPIITESVEYPHEMNLYAFTKNNPVTYYDPDGRSVNYAGIGVGEALYGMVNFFFYDLLNINNHFYCEVMGKRITKEADIWINTPYRNTKEEGGTNSVINKHGCCAGTLWGILSAIMKFTYKRANEDLINSFGKGGDNEGVAKELPSGWKPQAGDIGYWKGHVVIYAYREGSIDFVYNASKTAGIFQIQRLAGIIEYGFGNQQPVWYRLCWPMKPKS